MEELLDSHQGVVHKMKTLQVRQHARGVEKIIEFSFYEMTAKIYLTKNFTVKEKARTINESLQEKGHALDEATAAIDDLESKLDQTVNALESERKGHAITRLQRDDALEMLECARADHATNTLELKEQIQLCNLRELADDPSSSDAEKMSYRKTEERSCDLRISSEVTRTRTKKSYSVNRNELNGRKNV